MSHSWQVSNLSHVIAFFLQLIFSGFCFGTIVEVTESDSVNECLDLCQSYFDCEWFTYQEQIEVCQLTSDCQYVDESPQEDSVYGPRNCEDTSMITRFK